MGVRLALFDIDGTLIRTGGVGVKAFARAFETEFGIRNGTEGMQFAGRTDTSLVREILLRHRVEPSPDIFERFFDTYTFWLDYLLRDGCGGLCPGVEHFLNSMATLRPAPILGLLTGNIRLGAEIKLRRYNFWHPFVTGGFGDDDEDRDQIARIAWRRGEHMLQEPLPGHQVLVVGDTPLDVRCGKSIGARVLAVATGGAKIERLKETKADWVVPDLTHANAAELCA